MKRDVAIFAMLIGGCAHAAHPTTFPAQTEPAAAVEEATPESAAPEHSVAFPCDWLSEGTAVYRPVSDGEDEDGLTPFILVSGHTRANEDLVDTSDEILLQLTEHDVNGDELTDYYGTPGPDPWCSSYDGCVRGIYVGCDGGLAELWPPTAPGPRVTETFTEIDGIGWPDLMTSERGASWTEELEDEEQGLVGGSARLRRMGADRRYHPWPEAEARMVETCRSHSRAGRFEEARPFCHNAQSLVGTRALRGEMTFHGGLIAESRGDVNEARELYERALQDRPDDDAIRVRLDAAPPPSEE